MTSFSRFFLSSSLAVLCFASAAMATTLSFLADLNLPAGSRMGGTTVGGLSGLSYDPVTGTLLIISDDKSEHGPTRFYAANLSASPGRLELSLFAVTTLLRENGTPFPPETIDPEAIAILDNHRLFISSEGIGGAVPRIPPAIFETDGAGHVLGSLAVPAKYIPESLGRQTQGTVDNCAFESLALTPSRAFLYTATECPLVQDDTPSRFAKGGLSRILQFRLDGGRRIPGAEFLYLTEPNPKPAGATADYGSGISEMLALNERQLLVLERGAAGVGNAVIRRARIFKATLGGSATNVASLASIRGRAGLVPVKKELVLDLNSIIPELDPKWRSLDNLEGMTFGPTLPNGHRTLILISDDNFKPSQRTQVLAFEITAE